MMNCPACGSKLKQHTTDKGVLFLVCTQYPKCSVSGTPELFEMMQKPTPSARGIMKLGDLVRPLAQLRILQSKLKVATTTAEREAIQEQAQEILRNQNPRSFSHERTDHTTR